ncbi:disulfide bond formation protein DsbA [Subtercola boreus]|uniref:Disulfide bond formation protein DsbA n=1 Tax=Subtercola boreus TaxID=120213 RepID=A0A3E0V9S2_9MICO|nr:thioredoxin domain-containing protein [Subtercola boreus]RFA06454.1 disulfide bond formation protein DsbA [Subtercola boreus]
MKTSTKWNISIAVTLFVCLAAIVTVFLLRPSATERADAEGLTAAADNSHRLSVAADGQPVFVEFLDFECEVCGAAYPAIEQLRQEYAGRVSFVARYFPIPSHKNSMNAAIAVEAAAQQGQFEAMYKKMFDTQTQWSEQQDSKASVFRGYAEELGLDMVAFDGAVADPATKSRVQSDFSQGTALGVQGTPTFFLDDKKLDIGSVNELRTLFDAALTP